MAPFARAIDNPGAAGIQIQLQLQLQLQLDRLQVAWLDDKVTEFDAPFRSALVSAAFRLHIQAEQTAGE
jgi:hypothetical protein